MKRIGLIGGTSPESTLYYYGSIVELSRNKFEKNFYPEVVIFSLNFKKFRELPTWDEKMDYIMEGIRALECSGAEVISLTANTPHKVFPQLQERTGARMVSIIDAVAEEAKRRGYRKLLLLGTKITMSSRFYIDGLEKHGLEVLVPNQEEMDRIDQLIFQELAIGNFDCKDYLVNLINGYAGKVDAAILGCTELPLALKEGDTEIPLLDSARIHVEAIVEEALKT